MQILISITIINVNVDGYLHMTELTLSFRCALISPSPRRACPGKRRVSQATRMRKRHRFNTRMTRIILLISFLFFFGRFVYSSIGAWYHHQDKIQSQQSSLNVDAADR